MSQLRVLVHTHRLETGGSQRNAIDLAATVRDRGHDVLVYGAPGASLDLVHARGLPFVPAPDTGDGPTQEGVRALRHVVEEERIDLVHAYEWGQALTGFRALRTRRTPLVFTIYSMSVPHWLPRSVPLIVGTRQLKDATDRWWKGPVHVIEPPIDVAADAEPLDLSSYAAEHGLGEAAALDLVVVSRLVEDTKAEGIRLLIDVVGEMAVSAAVRLVIVGGGESFDSLRQQAEAVNDRVGRRAVVLTGAMADPRAAYQFADVVLGMGSSALRGMVTGKPVVVLGVGGYSDVVTPDSYGDYQWWGFLGVGCEGDAARRLRGILEDLMHDPERRRRLGEWSRETATADVGLEAMAARVEQIYRESRLLDVYGAGAGVEMLRSGARRAVSQALPPALKGLLSRGRSQQLSAVPGTTSAP